jgi:hypothetical protein|tara:strand:- start:717 stop:890 length:174 start_codon:yes stop_codon:yes gene_type:complete
MPNEWFYITSGKEKDEQKRDVGRGSEEPVVFYDDDRFTISDGVPIVSVNDEEDDFDD